MSHSKAPKPGQTQLKFRFIQLLRDTFGTGGAKHIRNVHKRRIAIVIFLTSIVSGCSNESPTVNTVPGRWYTAEQVVQGEPLFMKNCSGCHGQSAESTPEWRTVDANGNYPPPPLNGTAHTWHHPMAILEQTIAVGGIAVGGVMPGFASTLNEDETRATIAYFQNIWSDEIYLRWQEINNR